MSDPLPTKPGDVLILRSEVTVTYTVGVVLRPRQEDFDGEPPHTYSRVPTRLSALSKARGLVGREGRIFMKDRDAGDWIEIPRSGWP